MLSLEKNLSTLGRTCPGIFIYQYNQSFTYSLDQLDSTRELPPMPVASSAQNDLHSEFTVGCHPWENGEKHHLSKYISVRFNLQKKSDCKKS